MANERDETVVLQGILDRVRDGDEAARSELLERACDRLRRLARRELRGFPLVKRWEDTSDVLTAAMLRLDRALKTVPVGTVREFLALSSTQIRRELIDLWRHYYGPLGMGKHHASRPPGGDTGGGAPDAYEPVDRQVGPLDRAVTNEIHELVGKLPKPEQEVFELLYYQGLSQQEAAKLLHLEPKAVSRRHLKARLLLGRALQGSGRPE